MTHQCPFCGGACSPQSVDHKVRLGSTDVGLNGLVVQVCSTCGEEDLSLDKLIELERDAARRILPDYEGFDEATRVAVRKALPYEEWGDDPYKPGWFAEMRPVYIQRFDPAPPKPLFDIEALRSHRAARAFLEGDPQSEGEGGDGDS